eukprot:Gb_37095 [translate_table: standard]
MVFRSSVRRPHKFGTRPERNTLSDNLGGPISLR